MPKKKPKKSHLRLTKQGPSTSSEEWLLINFQVPQFVTGEGTPYRPVLLAWIDEAAQIVGNTVAHPDDLVTEVGASFQQATAAPAMGEPRRPKAIYVAGDIFDTVQSSLDDVVIKHAPQGAADEMTAQLMAGMEAIGAPDDDDGIGLGSYLELTPNPKDIELFFDAMAKLYRIRPWDIVTSSDAPIAVWLPAPYDQTVAVCVMGQSGETFGLLVFDDEEEFESYLDAVMEDESTALMPQTMSLNFERGAELPRALRKEITEHGWNVASPDGYPWLIVFEPEDGPRPVSPDELRKGTLIAEAVALALQGCTAEEIEDAFVSGALDIRVENRSGDSQHGDSYVSIPYRSLPLGHPEVERLALSALQDAEAQATSWIELSRSRLYRDAMATLIEKFSASKDASERNGDQWLREVFSAAVLTSGHTLASVGPHDLNDVLFEFAPSFFLITGDDAADLIALLADFYIFLERTNACPEAKICRRFLHDVDVDELSDRLHETLLYSSLKKKLLAGMEEGFDVHRPEGIDAWEEALALRGITLFSQDEDEDEADDEVEVQSGNPARVVDECSNWADHLEVPHFELKEIVDKRLTQRAKLLAALLLENGPLTLEDAAHRLVEAGIGGDVESTVRSLRRGRIGGPPFLEEDGHIILDPYDLEARALSAELRASLRRVVAPPLTPQTPTATDVQTPLSLEELADVFSDLRLPNVRTIIAVLDAMGAHDASKSVPSQRVIDWMESHGVQTKTLEANRKEMLRRDRAVDVTGEHNWHIDELAHRKTLLKVRKVVLSELASERARAAIEARRDLINSRYELENAEHQKAEDAKTRAVIAYAEEDNKIAAAFIEKTRKMTSAYGDRDRIRDVMESYDVVVGVDIVAFARRIGVSRSNVELIELLPKTKTVTSESGTKLKVTLPALVSGVFEDVGYGGGPKLAPNDIVQELMQQNLLKAASHVLLKSAEAMFHLATYADHHGCMWVTDKKEKISYSVPARSSMNGVWLNNVARTSAEKNTPFFISYGRPIGLKSKRGSIVEVQARPRGQSVWQFVYEDANGRPLDEELFMQIHPTGPAPTEGYDDDDDDIENAVTRMRSDAELARIVMPMMEQSISQLIPLEQAMRPGEEVARVNLTAPIGTGELAGRRFTLEEWYCATVDCDCRRVTLAVIDVETEKPAAHLHYAFDRPKRPIVHEPQFSLDPLRSQGPHAKELLRGFRDIMRSRPGTRQHFIGHYDRVKAAAADPTHPAAGILEAMQVTNIPPSFRRKTSAKKAAEPSRNAPCPCGSGKKYKKCCLNKSRST